MRTILQRAGGKRLFFNSWKISKASAAVLIFFVLSTDWMALCMGEKLKITRNRHVSNRDACYNSTAMRRYC